MQFPGAGFDPAAPRPLTPDTIIDISHESLIRQWKQLSAWVEAEGRARRQWQRLRDRFDDKQPLQGSELATMVAWRREQQPSAAWARRYGGDFAALMKFMDDSEWRRRRFAPLVLPIFSFAAFMGCGSFALGALYVVDGTGELPPWAIHYLTAAYLAISCAYGLWRYAPVGRALARDRALAAGATMLIVSSAGGGLFVYALTAHGHGNAEYLWRITFNAPVMITAMAIFNRRFQTVYMWTMLVGTNILAVILFNAMAETDTVQGPYILAGWALWFALLGYQLARIDIPIESEGHGPLVAAGRLALVVFLLVVMVASFSSVAVTVIFDSVRPSWWWLTEAIGVAIVVALTLTLGLQDYRGLNAKEAALAGLTVFVFEFVPGAALVAALLSHNVPEIEAGHWAVATVFAPTILAALAILDRSFRNVRVWLLFALLFAVPYGAVVGLADTGRIAVSPELVAFLILIFAMLWFGAIGYWLRGTSPETSRGETGARGELPPAPGMLSSAPG